MPCVTGDGSLQISGLMFLQRKNVFKVFIFYVHYSKLEANIFPGLAFGLLFHRFKTIFDRMKTVYCRDRNQQMQSKYSCSQSQGDAKSINKQRETRFPTQLGKFVIRPQATVNLSLSHTTRRVTVFLVILFRPRTMFLHSSRQRRWECFSSRATLTTRRTAES